MTVVPVVLYHAARCSDAASLVTHLPQAPPRSAFDHTPASWTRTFPVKSRVLENPGIAGEKGRIETTGRRHQQTIERVSQRITCNRADSTYVALDAPQPDVRVEEQHDQLVMSYVPSIGSKGRSYLSAVPFIEPKNEGRAGSE